MNSLKYVRHVVRNIFFYKSSEFLLKFLNFTKVSIWVESNSIFVLYPCKNTEIKMRRIILSILFFLLISGVVFAQPNISGIGGNFRHNDTVMISGSDFGSKNPAAPLLWDDCRVERPMGTYYDCYLPVAAQQGSQYNMMYHEAPFRSIQAPHNRITYVLSGAHAINTGTGGYERGGNVLLGKNLTSHRFFVNYWYRIDPNFDEENHPTYGDNMKELDLSETAGGAYGGSFGYYNWCVGMVPDENFRTPTRLQRIPEDLPNLPYSCSDDQYVVTHNNPINGWVKMQWEGDYSGPNNVPLVTFTTYPDGQVTYQSHFGNKITTMSIYNEGPGTPKEGNLQMLSIGGFARIPRFDNGVHSFRYFAGVYIDDTPSRVMLGDNQDYNSCTIMEPQIPTAWNEDSITINVNLGALPDSGTGYLFVFDSGNNHNLVGHSVVIGESPGDSPDPPQRAEIINIVQ